MKTKNGINNTKMPMKEQYAVYEKVPAHGSEENGAILGPYDSKEDAEKAAIKYGYTSSNYYIDKEK
jgi:hypothetical protein